MRSVNFEEAFKEIDDLVFAKTGRRLNQLEKIALEAAWEDKDYGEVASDLPCSVDHLRSNVGRRLWLVMTGVLGGGEKVTKKRFRGIFERRMIDSDTHSTLGISEEDQSKFSGTSPSIFGEQPPDVSRFYGRVKELEKLRELIGNNSCVALVGAAGIGKSALAAKLILEIAADPSSGFNCLTWKSIRSDLSPFDLVTELIGLVAAPSKSKLDLPLYAQARISVLINCLKSRRCLLVLDGADAVWRSQREDKGGDKSSRRWRHAEFRIFLKRLMEEDHQSCFVLTGRQRFSELDELQNLKGPVSCLEVKGLDLEDAKQFLRMNNLKDEETWDELIQDYGTVPSALKLVSKEIQKKFNGRVREFIEFKTLTANVFEELLEEQFRDTHLLDYLERQIIIYLAEELSRQSDCITQATLLRGLKAKMESFSTAEMLDKIEILSNLSLIQKEENIATGEVCFSLQPLLRRYAISNREILARGAA